jgi:small GTP-binding protein
MDNPAMDVLNEKEDFYAKTQIKNIEVFEYKIILVGDPGVGKTSILTKFVTNEFQSVYSSTIGVEFKLKDIYVNNNCARLKIWDTCGQEKFRAITRQYFKNSNGVFIVFDLTNKDTIKRLNVWMKDINDNITNDFFVFLIGNKVDIKDRDISISEEAKQFANNQKINYYEVSAKTGSGIYNVFEKMANKLVSKDKMDKSRDSKINPIKLGNKSLNIDDYNKDRGTILSDDDKSISKCC